MSKYYKLSKYVFIKKFQTGKYSMCIVLLQKAAKWHKYLNAFVNILTPSIRLNIPCRKSIKMQRLNRFVCSYPIKSFACTHYVGGTGFKAFIKRSIVKVVIIFSIVRNHATRYTSYIKYKHIYIYIYKSWILGQITENFKAWGI